MGLPEEMQEMSSP